MLLLCSRYGSIGVDPLEHPYAWLGTHTVKPFLLAVPYFANMVCRVDDDSSRVNSKAQQIWSHTNWESS